jgi:hypothetical protein
MVGGYNLHPTTTLKGDDVAVIIELLEEHLMLK